MARASFQGLWKNSNQIVPSQNARADQPNDSVCELAKCENDGRRPHAMMASSTTKQGLNAALRGVSRNLASGRQWQPLEQQFQSLRVSQSLAQGKRCFSTEQANQPIQAAAEINLRGLMKKYTLATHARAVPVSPSYFSNTPNFNDRYLRLEKLMKTYGNLPTIPAADTERVIWKTLSDLRLSLGEPVKATDFVKCLALVKRLHQIHPQLKPAEVTEALEDFKRSVQAFLNEAKPIPIDRFGRALGVGRRKSSVARAWVVEGDGQVLINGKTLSEYFGRVHDRESAVWALHSVDRIDKYNIWARVEGGGTTGQAEALTLAIAKALLAHEPALKPALRRGRWSTHLTGPRTHEDSADPSRFPSRLRHARPEKGGEEEARPCQGEKGTYMGQEIVQAEQAGGLLWCWCCLHERPALGVLALHLHVVPSVSRFFVSTEPPITVQYKASGFPNQELKAAVKASGSFLKLDLKCGRRRHEDLAPNAGNDRLSQMSARRQRPNGPVKNRRFRAAVATWPGVLLGYRECEETGAIIIPAFLHGMPSGCDRNLTVSSVIHPYRQTYQFVCYGNAAPQRGVFGVVLVVLVPLLPRPASHHHREQQQCWYSNRPPATRDQTHAAYQQPYPCHAPLLWHLGRTSFLSQCGDTNQYPWFMSS